MWFGFLLILTACSSPPITQPEPQPPEVTIRLAGQWQAVFRQGDSELLRLSFELGQKGSSLSGLVNFPEGFCMRNARLTGSLTDQSASLILANALNQFDLQLAVLSQEQLEGTFVLEGSHCEVGSGRVILSRLTASPIPQPDPEPDPEPDSPVDYGGIWSGVLRMHGSSQDRPISLNLKQNQDSVSGEVIINRYSCLSEGVIDLSVLQEDFSGLLQGTSGVMSLTGAVRDGTMQASYSVLSGPCSGELGTVQLSRSHLEMLLDARLELRLEEHRVTALNIDLPDNAAQVTLGRLLMYDKELSGNRDISCATCHHAQLMSTDQLALSIGTGGQGLGPGRSAASGHSRIPRHAPELFNRGASEWRSLFWDGRLSGDAGSGFSSPAGEQLPQGLDSLLAAQAMLTVMSRAEMRGEIGDLDVFGRPNELAAYPDDDFVGVWQALMERILAIQLYQQLFAAAYPELSENELGFEHAASAIAAFQLATLTTIQSPFDLYLSGNKTALSLAEKRGADLFFGRANCAQCHSGPLLSDQQFHNIGIPQFGPGLDPDTGLDLGVYHESGKPADRYTFRTPPLRNVALTGPWMHNGSFSTLEQVIRHYDNPQQSLYTYRGEGLEPQLRDSLKTDPLILNDILGTLATEVSLQLDLRQDEVSDLIAFLEALTDPAVFGLHEHVPDSVPSGLTVDR